MRENRNHQHIFNIQLLSYDLYVILIQRHDSYTVKSVLRGYLWNK